MHFCSHSNVTHSSHGHVWAMAKLSNVVSNEKQIMTKIFLTWRKKHTLFKLSP